jgi:twitching motility protein PilI
METPQTAFELLLGIDQRCRQRAAELPAQAARAQRWSGIGFRLDKGWYVAPMSEIAEVMQPPPATRVPGVKPWLLGIANMRGRLLPLIDLAGYLSNATAEPDAPPRVDYSAARQRRRVLVVDTPQLYVGLLVDEVGGLQHFALHSLDPTLRARVAPAVAPFLQGHFFRERAWDVFSPAALVAAPGFRDVALQALTG